MYIGDQKGKVRSDCVQTNAKKEKEKKERKREELNAVETIRNLNLNICNSTEETALNCTVWKGRFMYKPHVANNKFHLDINPMFLLDITKGRLRITFDLTSPIYRYQKSLLQFWQILNYATFFLYYTRKLSIVLQIYVG